MLPGGYLQEDRSLKMEPCQNVHVVLAAGKNE